MAVYSAVTSGEKDPESPVTPELIEKLDQNPLAIIENASGAPEIDGAAITNGTIPYSALNLSNSVVAGDIAANAVRMSEFYTTIGSQGTRLIQAGENYNLPEDGYYLFKETAAGNALRYQVLIDGTWTDFDVIGLTYTTFRWFISGTMRIRNTTGSARTLTYQRFMG